MAEERGRIWNGGEEAGRGWLASADEGKLDFFPRRVGRVPLQKSEGLVDLLTCRQVKFQFI